MVFDGRHGDRSPGQELNITTTLGDAPKLQRTRKIADIGLQWGTASPSTEDLDKIVKLFERWQLHLDGLTACQGPNGPVRVKKIT